MPLLAYNITGSPITLTQAHPPVVLPASTNPPERGKAYDVTAELWPNVAVDPGNGRSGGLDAADFTALSAYIGVEFLWTHGAEYLTGALAPVGPPPAPHTHTAASTTAVNNAAGTGIAATGAGSSHNHSVASATPGITADKIRMQQFMGAVEAPGEAYIASPYAGGAIIDDAVGPFYQYCPSRTVRIVVGVGGVATVYTIDGLDQDGVALQDIINASGAGTFQGVKAFASITRMRSNVDPVGTTDVQTGNGFGLGVAVSDVDKVGLDGGAEGYSSIHAASGTVVPGTAPNGTHVYSVQYRVLPTATQAAHDHGGTSGAEAAHTHGITDPTHNHTQSGHGHSVA